MNNLPKIRIPFMSEMQAYFSASDIIGLYGYSFGIRFYVEYYRIDSNELFRIIHLN